jgi:hypothetical protein
VIVVMYILGDRAGATHTCGHIDCSCCEVSSTTETHGDVKQEAGGLKFWSLIDISAKDHLVGVEWKWSRLNC